MRKYSIGTITKKQILAAFNAVEDAKEELNDYMGEYADVDSKDYDLEEYWAKVDHLKNAIEECYQDALEMLYFYNDKFASYIDIDLWDSPMERCVENAIWCIEHDAIPNEVI